MVIGEKPLAVFGLGCVGLPLALSYSMKGYKVYGVDVSVKLINELKQGMTNLMESRGSKTITEILQESLQAGNFLPSTNPFEALMVCDKLILTVGIYPDGKNLNFVPLQNACSTIAQGLKKGDTVIIRSTLVPGTTEEKLVPLLENSGLKAGTDFYLAYSPERISEGKAFQEFESIPAIISGINPQSMKMGRKMIKMISKAAPIPVSDIKTAETVKVIENIHRDANIAIAHQFAGFCRDLHINVFEVIEAVNTHPRVNLLIPGPGVGGYCIPNALSYLSHKAGELGTDIALLELCRNLNSAIPLKIANEVKDQILSSGKNLNKAKVAVLGIAMKDYCSDDRQSPVINIINHLNNMGLSVKAFDPCVASKYAFKTDSIEQCAEKADLLLIAVVQKGIRYNDFDLFKRLMNENPILFDTKNIIDKTKAGKYGFKMVSI